MFKLPTPGGVVRRLIADMLLNSKVWEIDFCEAVTKTATGIEVRVCGEEGTVICSTDGEKPTREMMIPGPFRSWRLKNAVRRLAAARISKVLP